MTKKIVGSLLLGSLIFITGCGGSSGKDINSNDGSAGSGSSNGSAVSSGSSGSANGGGGKKLNPGDTGTGYYIDSAVAGVSYECGSKKRCYRQRW